MNSQNILRLSHNIKRKMFKFDLNTEKVIFKDTLLIDFFKNKKVLMIYPYPSKERLNSELYDDILKKLKIAKEIQEDNINDKIHNKKYKHSSYDEKLESLEIYKTKYINELDDIVGLSEMNETMTEEYVEKTRVPDIWFIVDESNSLNNMNKLNDRYEMVIDNMRIVEFRPDPTIGQNIYLGFVFAYLFVLMLLMYIYGYNAILKSYSELKKKDKLINLALKD